MNWAFTTKIRFQNYQDQPVEPRSEGNRHFGSVACLVFPKASFASQSGGEITPSYL